MGAYNRTNGEPCCASPALLQRILREEWGFTGSPAQSAALAVRSGCDLECGQVNPSLVEAVR